MQNMSHRHRRMAQKMNLKATPDLIEYVIVDADHRPDIRGEFAGAKVTIVGHQHVVWLSAKTARFYLDSGSIKPFADPKKAEIKTAAQAVRK